MKTKHTTNQPTINYMEDVCVMNNQSRSRPFETRPLPEQEQPAVGVNQLTDSPVNSFSKRSKVMNATRIISRAMMAVVTLFLVAAVAMGQNLNLSGGSATLTGTWNVRGNVNNNSATGVKTFSGTVNLNGTTSAQNVGGTTASQALVFANLNAVGTQVKDQKVQVTVTTAFDINSGAAYNVAANTLNFGGTTTITSGTFNASNASSVVNYTSGAAQAVLSSTYGGTLGLSGGAKTLGGDVSAGVLNQTAGSITVNNNLTLTGTSSSSFLTITDISATKTLLKNATGTLTVGTLSANSGIISLTAAGTINFTGAAASAGQINASAGTIDFDAGFNNTGGTLNLSASGAAAIFGGSFTSQTAAGTLTLASGTTVTYDGGSAQNAAGASYHHLVMSGAGVKTALGNLTVGGNFTNTSATTDVDTYTLAVTGSTTNTGGTVRFGGTTNGIAINAGTVEYNGGDAVTQTIGAGTYATLTLSRKSGTGVAAKTIANGATVTTTGSMSVPVETSLTLGNSSSVLNVNGDFNVDGDVTNNGTITVGN